MDNISIVVRQPPAAAIVVKGEPPSPRPSPRGGEGSGTNTLSPVGRGRWDKYLLPGGERAVGQIPSPRWGEDMVTRQGLVTR